MPISSDTLFHFTDKIEHLVNILNHTFRPHYCLENMNVMSQKDEYIPELEFAMPMVCFCDIPLSNTKNHMDTYGFYGIGLTKKWGIENGITPVLYTYSKSGIVTKLNDLVRDIKHDNEHSDTGSILLDRFYEIACYVKPYEGLLSNFERSKETIRFYDEREWRYVSDFVPEDYKYGLAKEDYSNENIFNEVSRLMYDADRIHFEPSDIKYLIVKKENEILPLIRMIEEIKRRFSRDEIKLLTTRIVSSKNIQYDF